MGTGISGNFWSFVKRVEDPFDFQGKRGLSLETLQGKRASSSLQVRILSFEWSCGWKIRVPRKLPVDLGDHSCFLREVRSPLALRGPPQDSSRITAGMNRALSRVEAGTSSSSPFLTLITGSLQSWNRRVRPHLVLTNGTLIASRVVHGVTDHLLSCIWNLAAVSGRCNWGVSAPSCCDFIHRVPFEEVLRHQDLS